MDLTDLNTGMQVVERSDCMALLATEELGRLAVVVGARPEIFPINYAVDGDGIVFRTDLGTKLVGARSGPVVFEVDHLDRDARSAWSVILHGRTEMVSDADRARLGQRISRLSLYLWNGSAKPHILRLVPTTVTGRRIQGRAAASSSNSLLAVVLDRLPVPDDDVVGIEPELAASPALPEQVPALVEGFLDVAQAGPPVAV